MELRGDFMSWAFTILMLIASISIPLFIQYLRNGEITETVKTSAQATKAQLSVRDATTRFVTYRLRGIPSKFTQHDVKELINRVLALEQEIIVDINSLADDPSRHGERVATLEFSKTPGSLSKEAGNAEWKFLTYDGQCNDHAKITLVFDTHFRGLTPLHSRSDSDCTIDLIAVSGLGSHAFGSFKERQGSHMWLRDSLAHDIPNMRILIYGYDTQMDGSTSFANLDDLANEFQERIKSIRSYPRLKRSEIPTTSPERPLILIGHSLGGIIIKAALIRMNDGDNSDKANFKSVYGMLFFGVPNQGMPISQWIPIVEGQPNRFFIEQLCASSDILRVFRTDFRKIFTFHDSKIYSFYETKESPTAQRGIGNKWELTGPRIRLVDTASATHGRSWEEVGNYIKPIHRTHSDLVKFSQIDDDYTTVSNCLLEFTDTACDTIMKRFLSRQEILQLFVEFVSVDKISPILQSMSQEQLSSTISSTIEPVDRDWPDFSWIFNNVDFQHWETVPGSQILLIYGPPGRNLHRVSSYIANESSLKKQRDVLFHSCLSESNGKRAVSRLACALFYQLICHTSKDRQKSIIEKFINILVKRIYQVEENYYTELEIFKRSSEIWLRKILNTSTQALWTALMEVLIKEPRREILVVIDGLENVQDETREFIDSIRSFVNHVRDRNLNIKALFTSRPQADIQEHFDDLPSIEHDKERRDCQASLYFENSRYSQIAKEHEGSLEWVWTHDQYKEWSKPNVSRFLYLQGKPGSGKSTFTRYFEENLLKQDLDAKDAIVAKFFYSERDGELQRSHYNMLRCIFYEILGQHEALFYRYFQSEYRVQKKMHKRGISDLAEWDYESLKRILSSITDFSPVSRLYLIIDAVDESDDDDRRNILNLMFDLCSKPKDCVVKIFLASRPIGILSKTDDCGSFGNKFLSIKLQDQTKPAIARFAYSFLKDLDFSSFLDQATEYIAENAQGVFLWVQLVKKELVAYDEAGRCAEKDIFEFLQSLPTELEELYQRMLNKMGRNKTDTRDGIRMFQLVLFASRPLIANEMLHALAIPGDRETEFAVSEDCFTKNIPPERRIIHCGGNFLEIKRSFGNAIYMYEAAGRDIVQVMHQTVREFFLRPDGFAAASDFKMNEKAAHICISITCIRYLMLFAANMAQRLPDVEVWTSRQFEDCAQYLNEMTFLNYALCYLMYHIDGCQGDAYVLNIASSFIDGLPESPAAYLLQNWVYHQFGHRFFKEELSGVGTEVRNRTLFTAAWKGYQVAAGVSLILGADVDIEAEDKMTPLHIAAGKGYAAVVRLLLNGGAKIESKDVTGRTPLSWASAKGHEAVVRLLLDSGANMETIDIAGRTPLLQAAANGHAAVVKLLLVEGSNTEAKDRYRHSTSLSWAATNGHEEVVRVLSDSSADLEPKDKAGRTPLIQAAANGHEGVVKLLLSKGCDMESKDGYRQSTPLSWAAMNGHQAVVQVLSNNGASLECMDRFGRKPLLWAAANGYESVVKLLLSKGAERDSKKNQVGRTPLSWATENGHEAVVSLLLDNNIDQEFKEDG